MSELQLGNITLYGPKFIRNSNGMIFRKGYLWRLGDPLEDDSTPGVNGALTPASVNVESSEGYNIEVMLYGLKDFPPGRWWLCGHQGNITFAMSQQSLEVDKKLRDIGFKAFDNVLFRPPWARKDFPWGFAGDIEWELRKDPGPVVSNKEDEVVPLGTSRLEIYGITRTLPDFFGGAVDVEFLRKFVLPAKSSSAIDWPRHVVKAVFWDFGFRYNSYHNGTPSYASGILSETFHLRRWIQDAGKHELVNCYDQAGIVQIALGLAPRRVAECQIMHLSRFGFINSTELVGRGFTNNPFPAMNKDGRPTWLVDRNDKHRSSFGNHTFVRLGGDDGVILDACAGPHLGTETLSEYMVAAISWFGEGKDPNSTTLYAEPGNSRLGTIGDLHKDHRGVTAIDVCPIPTPENVACVLAHSKDNYKKKDVDDAMARARPSGGIPKNDETAAFKLSDFTKALIEASQNSVELSPYIQINDYGARVAYDIPYFLSNGTEKDQIDVQIVVLKDNTQATSYFEWDLYNYHNSDPARWGKLEDPCFKSRLSLAGVDAEKHGVIVWVRGQIFFRISGYPSSHELWNVYGKKLDELARTACTDIDSESWVPEFEDSQEVTRLKPPSVRIGFSTDELAWTVSDTTKDPNYEACFYPRENKVILEEWDKEQEEMVFNFSYANNVGSRTLHWNFANKDDSLKVYSVNSELKFLEPPK